MSFVATRKLLKMSKVKYSMVSRLHEFVYEFGQNGFFLQTDWYYSIRYVT